MQVKRVLIANRGEIVARIARSCRDNGYTTLAIQALGEKADHPAFTDASATLSGSGAQAYRNIDDILAIAKANDCDAIHPGYGFLSESAEFARACEAAGIDFIGPSPDLLEKFGDKQCARTIAESSGVPVLPGILCASAEDAHSWALEHSSDAPFLLKAVSGGGGRGIVRIDDLSDLEASFAAATREAEIAFGNPALYTEALVAHARHIEVQVLGDGNSVACLGERECSLQRRGQKVVEMAPALDFAPELSSAVQGYAKQLFADIPLRGLATVEFLLHVNADGTASETLHFMEVNPRIQVEHTVTEEVYGVDLVAVQLGSGDGS